MAELTGLMHIAYVDGDMSLIPGCVTVPAGVAQAMAARDEAFDAYGEALIKYDDVIGLAYIERAQERDAARAREAVLKGEDPHDGPSEVARVTAERGRAIGVVNALAERVRQHDREVYRQWAQSLPGVEAELRDVLPTAASELRKAETAYRAAKSAYRQRIAALAYVALLRRGKVRTMADAPAYIQNPPNAEYSEEQWSRIWLADRGIDLDDAA